MNIFGISITLGDPLLFAFLTALTFFSFKKQLKDNLGVRDNLNHYLKLPNSSFGSLFSLLFRLSLFLLIAYGTLRGLIIITRDPNLKLYDKNLMEIHIWSTAPLLFAFFILSLSMIPLLVIQVYCKFLPNRKP